MTVKNSKYCLLYVLLLLVHSLVDGIHIASHLLTNIRGQALNFTAQGNYSPHINMDVASSLKVELPFGEVYWHPLELALDEEHTDH